MLRRNPGYACTPVAIMHGLDEQHKRDKCLKPYRMPHYVTALAGVVCFIAQGWSSGSRVSIRAMRGSDRYGCLAVWLGSSYYCIYYFISRSISHHPSTMSSSSSINITVAAMIICECMSNESSYTGSYMR
ncbi:uncharacterized protein F4812DRAFT_411700 [Daldinia caldariorum]|uniref:uncharacterized protein n=1 Tax=Daldinia caldariorum TaxID=326644 RepID=UPI00200743B2|nr:uncharacterized protein F4812DRAFT_411700 [Daldinia caldariorum]KAI1473130.1 hypothetical protein F4812DRAFT_411700 [Daldinia caldariorum]